MGQSEAAFDSIRAIFHLARAGRPHLSGFLSFIVANNKIAHALTAIRGGIAKNVFSPEELRSLQNELEDFDLLGDFTDAARAEIISATKSIRATKDDPSSREGAFPSYYPVGWIDQSCAAILTELHRSCIAPLKTRDIAAFKKELKAMEAWIIETKSSYLARMRLSLALMTLPLAQSFGRDAARFQAHINQARIECALHRHFITNGTFPDTLENLVPDFLDAIPIDPMDQKPMRYLKMESGGYMLYSIGWDLVDDGGTTSIGNHRPDPNTGDWIWSTDNLQSESD